jgi:phage terminase large subunit
MATALPELFRPPEREERFAEWTQVQALADLGRLTPYNYDRHYLPHDVKLREWGSGARSRIETLQRLGMVGIHRGAAANPSDRIQAVRRLLPVTRFNDTPRVQMGLKRLKRYRRKWNDALQSYTVPLHDENSHGADAFGEFAINSGLFPPIEKPAPKPVETRMPTLDELVAEHDKRHARMSRRGVA